MANKTAWRAAVQRRTSRIARILRVLPSVVVAPTVERAKASARWIITATGVDGVSQVALEVVTGATARTIEQLGEPIAVHVHRPDLVDLARLDELELGGSVSVVFAEARP